MDKGQNQMRQVWSGKKGNTIIRVYRSELSQSERERRMKSVYQAIAECYRPEAKSKD